MSNWDDDFWSDQEAAEVDNVPDRNPATQTAYSASDEDEPDLNVPDLPPIELPSPSFGISPSANSNSIVPNTDSASPIFPNSHLHHVQHSSPDHGLSQGWGWSSLAAKVTSSAADLILMPDEAQQKHRVFQHSTEELLSSPTRSRARTGSKSKWFESLGSVLENVKASAGQSGRELIQVATEALVKKPLSDNLVSVSPSSRHIDQDLISLNQTDLSHSERSQTRSTSFHSESELARSSSRISPHRNENLKRSVSRSRSRSPSPVASHTNPLSFSSLPRPPDVSNMTADSLSWNGQWDIDQDDQPSTIPSHTNDNNPHSPLSTPVLTKSDGVGAGWLQDVFEGVRISAAQSGQELLEASGALTSEVLQKAKNIVPKMDTSQESVFRDLPGRKHESLSPPSSPHTLNEFFSSAPMLSASDRESPEEDDSDFEISQQENIRSNAFPNQEFGDAGPRADAEPLEVVWDAPELPDSEKDCVPADFDTFFSSYGGAEFADKLEKIGRERTIYLERSIALFDSDSLEIINEVGDIIRQDGSPHATKTFKMSSIERLIADLMDWHVSVLKSYTQRSSRLDMFEFFDQIHVLCTRTLAILATRTIDLLVHFVEQLNGDRQDPLTSARSLNRLVHIFRTESHSFIPASIAIVRQLYPPNTEYDEDITVLAADIEVDVFEARFKVEDAVGNIAPILQCMALPQ